MFEKRFFVEGLAHASYLIGDGGEAAVVDPTTRITGALADGASFSQTVPVSQTGYVPICANLYASKGLLLGWINLDLTNTAGVSLTWIHPERVSGLYQKGFTNVLLTNQILLRRGWIPREHWPSDKIATKSMNLAPSAGDLGTLRVHPRDAAETD
jgi:hypothetical protein